MIDNSIKLTSQLMQNLFANFQTHLPNSHYSMNTKLSTTENKTILMAQPYELINVTNSGNNGGTQTENKPPGSS